jgi:ferric-dicitrate binding protein FerR (iron transport regulator)
MTDQGERAQSDRGAAGEQARLEPSPELAQLLELARKSLTGHAPKRNAGSAQLVERARALRARRRRALGAAAVACAALLGSWVLFLWLRPDNAVALRFQVENGSLSPAGVVEAAAEATRVTFSDGTELALAAHGRARVEALSAQGADVGLERGSAKMDVVPRPGARWSVRAGPYLVRVTGTSFSLEFEPEQSWLKLDLLVGSVSVSGPLIDGVLHVSAGQRLLVRPGDALVLVQRRESDVSPSPSAVPPAAVPPSVVAPSAAQPAAVAPEVVPPSSAALAPTAPANARFKSASESHSRRALRGRRSARAEPPASAAVEPSWHERVAAGQFAEVIALAEARELARVLREAPLDDLEALADAARYARRKDLARPALLALRERFAGSRAAREAAFLLGRLEERAGAARGALSWYERYLSDDPNGAYAAQALGRQLSLSNELGAQRARAVAHEYLQRFPRGPYAALARELSGAK